MRNNLKKIATLCLTLLTILVCASLSLAQANPKAGDTGTTAGTVTQITNEFILIQPPGNTPQRFWFKWISPAGTVEDRSAQPTIATLKSGDAVEAQWSFDGQRRLESIALATLPVAEAKPTQQEVTPVTPPTPTTAPSVASAVDTSGTQENSGISTGDKVNAMLDDLLATGQRVLELPLFILLAAFGIGTAAVISLMQKIAGKTRPRLARVTVASVIAAAVLGGAVVLDRKLVQLQSEIQELHTRALTATMTPTLPAPTPASIPQANAAAPLLAKAAASTPVAAPTPVAAKSETPAPPIPSAPVTSTPPLTASPAPEPKPASVPTLTPAPAASPPSKRTTLFFDQTKTQTALAQKFGTVTIKPTLYDPATDIVSVHLTNPLAQAYLAIIDLHNPAVEIKFGFNLDTKTLTSQFARDNDCVVAINGEAGASPGPRSGLGVWRGYMVQQGKILLREDPTIPRPYLSFDPQNRATFTPLSAKDRTLPANPYNIIWGRVDALLNDTVQDIDPYNRQPRTAMALDQDNSHLYLFVVDGRQPRYSMGFTRGEVANFLKAFGAANAMLCDEGGSSCIYLKQINAIANIPSDGQGRERPTYTHFGISMRKG